MDSKWAAVLLLLLLLNWGHTEEAGSWDEDQAFAVSEHSTAPSIQPHLPSAETYDTGFDVRQAAEVFKKSGF